MSANRTHALDLRGLAHAARGKASGTEGWADEIEFRDGLILIVAQFDVPPPGWDEATAIS